MLDTEYAWCKHCGALVRRSGKYWWSRLGNATCRPIIWVDINKRTVQVHEPMVNN